MQLTIMKRLLIRNGVDSSSEMNKPRSSKYCSFEKSLFNDKIPIVIIYQKTNVEIKTNSEHDDQNKNSTPEINVICKISMLKRTNTCTCNS